MGVLSRFFNREKHLHKKIDNFAHSLVRHFRNLRDDFDHQKKWMDYLHNFSLRLQNDHHNHRSVTEAELNKVKSWINHLHSYQSRQENDIKNLEKNISELVSIVGKAFDDVHDRMEKIESAHKQKGEELTQNVQKMLTEHKTERPKEEPVQETTPQKYTLTNPENKLLNLLLTEPDPIGYTKIAEKTGNSISTVRVVMNSLKKKDVVEENILPSGEKLFNAKNKEKIKKIYNVSHI
ncbi:MAG: hypothetical protein ACOCZ6_03125 [Nanoarchaeota archaeon]